MPRRYELDNEMDKEGSYRITIKIRKKYILKARDWIKGLFKKRETKKCCQDTKHTSQR